MLDVFDEDDVLRELRTKQLDGTWGYGSTIVNLIAKLCNSAMNSLHLVSSDQKSLTLIAASGLPDSWLDRIRVVPIDAETDIGILGRCAARKQVAIAVGLSHPTWDGFRDAAREIGLRSAWSHPLIDRNGQLVGALATYYKDLRTPTPDEIEKVSLVAQMVVAMVATLPPTHWNGSAVQNLNGIMKGILIALEARDAETVQHSRRVTGYSLLLADTMNLTDLDQIALGAALHDIGKIGIPDAILRKPGTLTPQEYNIVKEHPILGYEMLHRYLTHLPVTLDIVRHHHERYDGEGYPDRLRGDEILPHTRMFGVIDAFDAITTDRPYRKALSVDEALSELARHRKTQFCPDCIDAFLSIDPKELQAVRRGEVSFDQFQVNTLWS